MITPSEFEKTNSRSKTFKHSSMAYTEFEEVQNYKIIHDDDNGIVLSGENPEKNITEIHWATNTVQFLKDILSPLQKPFTVPFVPEEWVEALKETGMEFFAIWNDYFKESLSAEETTPCSNTLTSEDAEKVSALTLSCKGLSRGFTGQSINFCEKWLSANSSDERINDKAIIGYFSENTLLGCVFVATYGEKKTLWIREIVVSHNYQGQGIGRKLMKQAFCYGIEKGVKRAFLAADECNENAIHLYKSLGFVCNPKDRQIDMIHE